MSETPRTDAETKVIGSMGATCEFVNAKFSRQLETALAAKERELEEVRSGHDRDRAELIERAESGFSLAETYKRELAEARERHGIQLAAVSTACIQNSETSAKDRIGRENPYWTVAYGDVCVAIDREMKLRRELEEAMDKLSKQLEAFDAMKQVAKYPVPGAPFDEPVNDKEPR